MPPTTSSVIWKTPAENPLLSDDSVHIWRIRLEQSSAVVEGLWQYLSADERQRAVDFHFQMHRRRFVVGRGALRQILGIYLSTGPGQVRFSYGECGKPEMFTDQRLAFNLSHSGDLALCAVAKGRRVGIDVEVLRPIENATSIASNYFSPAEIAPMSGQMGDDLTMTFLRCWTMKEALLKGRGMGLTGIHHVSNGSAPWTVRSFSVKDPDALATVAVTGNDWHPVHWEWAMSLP